MPNIISLYFADTDIANIHLPDKDTNTDIHVLVLAKYCHPTFVPLVNDDRKCRQFKLRTWEIEENELAGAELCQAKIGLRWLGDF